MLDAKNNAVYLGSILIAKTDGDVVVMRRNSQRHFYRALGSWCLNAELVNEFGFNKFIIVNEYDEEYHITYKKILEIKKQLNLHIKFGDEVQYAIHSSFWDFFKTDNKTMPAMIGVPVSNFATEPEGQWKSRLIKNINNDQIEIDFNKQY